ncbi:MAG: alkaline phosphatase family protein [Muribaculaceae bacterium]|nr:alkaline phosphatase family protein [Muribaculaceae bacterium]
MAKNLPTFTRTYIAALILVGVSVAMPALAQEIAGRPQLVVGIVVEGLTDDYLTLLRDHFGPNGFRRLTDKGVAIRDLDFGTPLDGAASTALLFTGASPSVNGIGAETVYIRDEKRPRQSLYDEGTIGNFTSETLSPAHLWASTISDELRIASGGVGYVYSIAPNPAEAIIMAGHAGNSAFWVNDMTGKWATTTFYRDLPTRPQEINHRSPLEYRLDTLQWVPMMAIDRYPDLPAHKKAYPFRHGFPRNDRNRYKAYKTSAAVNADIASMAVNYLKAMPLGKRDVTDMLSLSFTLMPYPYSRDADSRPELMDSYLRLDRDLSRIFEAIDASGPGMDKTLVFVTGTPLTRRQRRDDEKWAIPYGEFSSRKAVSLLNMYLMAIHGNGEWVSGYHDSQIFLNHKLIKDRGKDLADIRLEAARFLERMSGVSHAWSIDEVMSRQASENPEALRRNIVAATAGDIIISVAPGWQEIDDDSDTEAPVTVSRAVASTAPAFILAPQVAPKTIDTPVDARAIAPTVCRLLRIRSPNGAAMPPLRL